MGVNWASPDYDASADFSWATKKYMDYGYADLMDQMLIGAYASPTRVNGTTEWTMEGFCRERCYAMCMENAAHYQGQFPWQADACGKCGAGLPCSWQVP